MLPAHCYGTLSVLVCCYAVAMVDGMVASCCSVVVRLSMVPGCCYVAVRVF